MCKQICAIQIILYISYMEKTLQGTLFSMLLFCLSMNLNAQSNTVAAGGVATGSGGAAFSSIGQIYYSSLQGSGWTITQGVQQVHEDLATSVFETNIKLSASVYPNPTNEFLILTVENPNADYVTYQLYDLQGKLLINGIMESNETTISLKDIHSELCVLKVSRNNIQVKEFKIIKNK